MVVGRTLAATANLQQQMQSRSTEKRYLLLVRGNIGEDEGLIDAPIARDLRNRQRMAVRAGGRGAQTRFFVLERFGDWTLVEALLLTGRTHQLRVHFISIGHPVAGDDDVRSRSRAGLPGLKRQFVHSRLLRLRSPYDDAEHTFRGRAARRPGRRRCERLRRREAANSGRAARNALTLTVACSRPNRTVADWRPSRGHRVHRVVQCRARPPARRPVRAAHRRHRPRALRRRQREPDLRHAALARARLGRGARQGRSVRARIASQSACRCTRQRPASSFELGFAYYCWCTPERLEADARRADAQQAADRLRPPVPGHDARASAPSCPASPRQPVHPHARPGPRRADSPSTT